MVSGPITESESDDKKILFSCAFGAIALTIVVSGVFGDPVRALTSVHAMTPVRAINDKGPEAWQAVRLYPNPASEVGRAVEMGTGRWTLTDMQCRVLANDVLLFEAGESFEVAVSLPGLPDGLYAIQLQTPAGLRAFKFTKR